MRNHPASTTALSKNVVPAPVPVSLMAVLLMLMTLAVYWPVTGYDFVHFDDPAFVTSNAHVQGGLNWEGVKWAFGSNEGDYWHPLAWLSLMLDVSLFGQGASGFHFTNLAFHAANSVLLFLLVWWLTGVLGRSVVVAALFALHPLRVESVAWVTERKDVLSAFFGLLALIFYACYAERAVIGHQWSDVSSQSAGAAARDDRRQTMPYRFRFYLLSLCCFACGLMSKAMLVTWPFVMLLLDYWPLRRLQPSTLNSQPSTILRLVREKLPFFILSGMSCALTYLTEKGTQQAADAVASPLLFRIENALVAYARYLGKTFWPAELAVPYVTPGHWSWLEVGGSALVVVGGFMIVFWFGRRWPYLVMGWCWFLGTLIPVIGLTRGWGTFMADRFTYVPSIGLLIPAVWGVSDLNRGWRYRSLGLWATGGAAIVLCLALMRQQMGYWRDSEALFEHAVEVKEDNYFTHYNLGIALVKKGRADEAIRQLQEAIRLKPAYAKAHADLGALLAEKGQTDAAIRHFQGAIRLKPQDGETHYNLGLVFEQKGQMDEALRQYQEAVRLSPDYAPAHNNLGIAFLNQGRVDDAVRQYREAIRLNPAHAGAHYNLGNALWQKGLNEEAIRQYREALRFKPEDAYAHNNLGAALEKQGQLEEAIRQYREAIRLNQAYADARDNLARVLGLKNAPPGR
jgi:protein O-mannosyl-transferase